MNLTRQSLTYFKEIGATHYSTDFTEAGHPMAYKIKPTHVAAFKNGGWYTIEVVPETISTTLVEVPDDLVLPSVYHREIKGVVVDVYDFLYAFSTGNPALDHLQKKALVPGERGHKDLERDLKDIIWSAERAIDLIKENARDNNSH